jgi:hypothetical protein
LFIESKEWWYKNLFNVDLKFVWSSSKSLIYWGRWLKTFIPDIYIYAPLLNFDNLVTERCKLLLFLVLYLCISLFVSNRCLLLIVYKTNEYTGCPWRNVPDFGRVFLMLNYTDITQNTYIQSWTVTVITAREVWKYDSCYTLIDYQIRIKSGRNMWFL